MQENVKSCKSGLINVIGIFRATEMVNSYIVCKKGTRTSMMLESYECEVDVRNECLT